MSMGAGGAAQSVMRSLARDSSVKNVKLNSKVLDATTYKDLLKPSEYNPAVLYSAVEPSLYDNMLKKYKDAYSNSMEHR